MKQKVSVIWFKRDLRLSDHAPLMRAIASGHPIVPLYVIEPDYWRQPTSARRHWHFIHDCLSDLKDQFQKWGQPFFIRTGSITTILSELATHVVIDGLYAHEETGGLWSYQRDEVVRDYCLAHHIPIIELPSAGVARRFFNRDKWAVMRAKRMAEDRVVPPASLPSYLSGHLFGGLLSSWGEGTLLDKDDPLFGPPLSEGDATQQGGRKAAIDLLTGFLVTKSASYVRNLASPVKAQQTSSRLSPHLAYGTISSREVAQTIQNYISDPKNNVTASKLKSCRAVLSRLAWRCHFMQKLEDEPEIEYHAMHPLYEDVRGHALNEAYFAAWVAGMTGYPLIDACMRCLTKTGWLPFRMRAMLVSFASYHLWLDWRITAPHLARLFTDYEPGIHYSQFQMQSGVTGINTIRIYNPVKQSEDHDKDGAFIYEWCPELRHVPAPYVAAPHEMPPFEALSIGFEIGRDYPLPIVDNVAAMRAARDKIFAIRKQDTFHEMAARVYQKMGSRNSPDRRAAKKKRANNSKQLPLL